ncbi:MAG: matrixin family metalloprotease [Ignavibacteriales bacterium]|nr:matrixin family metalloprotease [Ignavibacteriales bacterium]
MENLTALIVKTQEENIPSELWLTDILDDFRGAFGQWARVQYGCVSFTESDPDPNVFGDQIQINFTSSASVFEGSPAGAEYTGALTALCVSDNKFVVTAVNHQTQAPYTTILFNNSDSRMFTWGRGLNSGFVNFTHVSLHELGHIIGLNHCTAGGYPVMEDVTYYTQIAPRVFLQDPDIEGLQNLCDYVTGIEDFITITSEYPTYNVDQTYAGVLSRTFIDVFPYGDYITQWGNYQIHALSNCGEILVYESPYSSVLIPSLPNYIWQRDSYGNVIAKVSTSGIDNTGTNHYASIPISISNVPNTFITEGTLTENTSWCGYIEITGDLTVATGVTLTVQPGTVINFLNSSALIVKGTLNSIGTSVFRIHYIFTTPSEGIKLKIDSDADIQYTDINGGDRGITIVKTTANIKHVTITNTNSGIRMVDENLASGNTNIEYVTFTDNNFGLWLNNSSPYFINNTITGSTKGVYCSNFSSPHLGYYTYGHNHITDNDYGVYTYANSNPNLGHYDPYNQSNNYGFNTIVNNTSYNLYANQYCTVVAHNNWWGSAPPNASLFYSGMGSSIDYYFWLSTPPTYNVQGEGKELKEQSQLADKDLEIDAPRIPIIVRLLNIRNLINSSRFREAFNLSKQVVSLFPDSALTNFALDLFWQAGKEYNVDSLTNNLTTIYNASDRTLCGAAGLILSGYLGENRLAFLDEIKSRFSNSYIAELALYDKFTYYYFNIEEMNLAGQILAQLETEFPESQSTLDAQKIYYNQGSNGNSSYSSLNKNNNTSEIELPKEYDLLGNYPNPFNPNTNISYALPFESEVEIKIFDIMGREIKTFNLNGASAGYHSILWDGLNNNGNQVSSGIYIYVFKARSLETTDQFTKSDKMIMLK